MSTWGAINVDVAEPNLVTAGWNLIDQLRTGIAVVNVLSTGTEKR